MDAQAVEDGEVCEMCDRVIPNGQDGRPVNDYFCSQGCQDNYIASWD